MKSFLRLGLLILSISLISSCTKEEENTGGTPSLSSFLKGNFNVTRTDYNGSVSNSFGSIPTGGTGTDTNGNFLFESFTSTTTYYVNTNISVSAGGQSTQYPIYLGGAGRFEILNESSFSINDAISGERIYNVSDRTSNSMKLTTGYGTDTLGASLNLSLEIYLTKD